MKYVSEYFQALVQLTNEMSPYLLLGFLFAGILHVFFPDEKINRMMGASNFKSVFKASLIGVPLPLCSCGVIPTGISFFKHGASKGSTVSFLISTPQTGIDSVMVTYSLIGLPFAVFRVVIAFITGIIGGIFTNALVKNNTSTKPPPANKIVTQKRSFKNAIVDIFRYAFIDFIKDIAKWLVIGMLIAAFITVLVPDDFFSSYISSNILSMLIILVASIPLYVCATGSVPIAAALILKGMSPGAAIVFLMAGPATNAATITVISKVMGKKSLFAYLASIIGGALFFGILIDTFFEPSFFTGFLKNQSIGHHHEIIPEWLAIASSIVLTFFMLLTLVAPLKKKLFKKKKPVIEAQFLTMENNFSNRKIISVKGMNCNHCKMTVENGLKEFKGINNINADIENEQVTITGENIDMLKLKDTIESLGYKYSGEL